VYERNRREPEDRSLRLVCAASLAQQRLSSLPTALGRPAPTIAQQGQVDHAQGAETILIFYFSWVAHPFRVCFSKECGLLRAAHYFASLFIFVSLNFVGSNKAGSNRALAFISK
jgi:hypothetical protein